MQGSCHWLMLHSPQGVIKAAADDDDDERSLAHHIMQCSSVMDISHSITPMRQHEAVFCESLSYYLQLQGF